MDSIRFGQDNHPELLETPLRGEMLREFVDGIQTSIDLSKELAEKIPYPSARQHTQETYKVLEDIVREVTKGLKGDAAASYGIDSRDLTSLIQRVTKEHPDDVDFSEATGQIVDAVAAAKTGGVSQDKIRRMLRESAIAAATETLMGTFHQCIAIQEGQEAAYMQMVEQQEKEVAKAGFDAKASIGDDEQGRQGFAVTVALNTLMLIPIIERLSKRGSRLGALNERMMYGENYAKTGIKEGLLGEIQNTLATVYGLDTDKASDREELRRIQSKALRMASEQSGIPIPKGLEL